jgi:microcystin-dependent protein
MSQPFVGEIRMFAGNFAPANWAFCDGQLLAISENTALFSLLGTTYGGDGQTTFALPNLQSRLPLHQGTSPGGFQYVMGQTGGEENVTLSVSQMPAHDHAFVSTVSAGVDTPAGSVLGIPANGSLYVGTNANGANPNTGTLSSSSNTSVGANQPHQNLMPYLATSFIISLFGIYPSRN